MDNKYKNIYKKYLTKGGKNGQIKCRNNRHRMVRGY